MALYMLLALVALTGGGAREDILSLVVLRPLSWLLLAWAIFARPERLQRPAIGPLIGLMALGVWMAIQLVPLPPSMWTALPGRQLIAEIGSQLGLADLWRPITMSPSETWNALFSLAVPAAAMVLVASLEPRDRAKAMMGVLVLALASAAFSLAQLAGPPEGPLYLYRVTNFGEPNGFFANRNHEAVLCAIAIVLVGWHVGRKRSHRHGSSDLRPLLFLFVVPLLLFLNLVGGSRLGLALGVFALLPAVAMSLRNERISHVVGGKRRRPLGSQQKAIAFGALALGVGLLTLFVSQSESLDRFMVTDASEEIRAQLLPIFVKMITEFMPFGSGFGSFEHVYPYFEPTALIERRYLNQAHNDLAQFIIEGGAPAVILLLAGLIWYLKRCLALWNGRSSGRLYDSPALPAAVGLAIFAVASVFDYPLRAPISMAVAAIFVCLLEGVRTRDTASADSERDGH